LHFPDLLHSEVGLFIVDVCTWIVYCIRADHHVYCNDKNVKLSMFFVQGSYYGMTADSCDRGYMGAAHLACAHAPLDEDKCHSQALELYSIMFNSQEFAGDLSSYQCTAPCIYDYIVNSERG